MWISSSLVEKASTWTKQAHEWRKKIRAGGTRLTITLSTAHESVCVLFFFRQVMLFSIDSIIYFFTPLFRYSSSWFFYFFFRTWVWWFQYFPSNCFSFIIIPSSSSIRYFTANSCDKVWGRIEDIKQQFEISSWNEQMKGTTRNYNVP